MKKVIVILAVLAIAAPVIAFHPNTQCDSCHIPHTRVEIVAAVTTPGAEADAIYGAGNLPGMPLWSGARTAATSFTNYAMGGSIDAVDISDPLGSTLLCLSCHDGGTRHAISDTEGDLATTHPMEFVYDTALATLDQELVNPSLEGSSTKINGRGTIEEDMLEPGTGRMNCNSCHDVHVSGLHGVTFGQTDEFSASIPHLVNIPGIGYEAGWGANLALEADYDFAYGALCTTCHIK